MHIILKSLLSLDPYVSTPEMQAKEMRSKIFSHMLLTRGPKYRSFLRYLHFFKYIAFAPVRGEFLESYYALMRYLDDIVDGDAALPSGYSDETEYISEKIKFLKDVENPKDAADFMMRYCFDLAEKFAEDFQTETRDILDSLLFDARRREKGLIFQKDELTRHFHLLDVRGTIRATLKVFKDDPDKYIILEPLGIACRHQYNLEDFESDIAAGFINIPVEEFERFGIRKEDLGNYSSQAIRSWLCYHAAEGMKLLSDHYRRMPKGNFSPLQKAVFKVVYEMPARRVFRKTLSDFG